MCLMSLTPARKSGLDNAYRSVQVEARLKENGLQSLIHQPAARNRPLSERQKSADRRARRCAPMWSTYSGTSGARWAERSCAPSASRVVQKDGAVARQASKRSLIGAHLGTSRDFRDSV
jgi:hypothetical protein